MKKLLAKIRKILHDRRTRQMLTRIVSVTAAIVVFITTYALVLPAITMESEANCGIEAHQHDESCYEDKLICGEIESPGHHHSEACYEVSKALVCEEQEHQHDDSCFDESGNLTCGQIEHTHDDTCYKESRELTCDIPESDGHQHSSACYERVLTCGKEIHTHSTACYDHASDSAASAPADFAAVATTELGSFGATVSASTEMETESGESDAASGETSDAWTTEKNTEGNTEGGAASSATTNASATATTTAGSSSTAAAAANTAAASTGNTAFDPAAAEDTYIPQLEPVIFEQLLTKDTGIYYYHAEEGEEAPENSADIADWKRVKDDTELTPADLLRVYLRYTIPAGTLNATNDIARYRLPANLHLTDQQMETINTTVNGVANQYVSLDTLEITDTEKYNTYLGIEATEGTRKPSDNVDEYFADHPDLEGQEYINAVVRAENVFDDTTGEYAGQDLVLTFSPYTVQKNQHEYDADGQPTKAGQKVDGWLCFDLHMDQIDWSEPVISTIDDSAESIQDNATPTQDESVETAEGSGSSDATEATEITDSETEEETFSSSSDPDALNTNTITEKKESSAEIIFAAKDKALKIDEISTELHLVEFNAIEEENDTTLDEQDQTADDSTDSAKPEMTDAETADDSTSEGEADKNESADETATAAGDQPESETEINAKTYPAVSFEDTITVQAGTLTTDNETVAQDIPAETAITVSVIAEEETFPLGTTMQLGTVEDMDTVASAVEGAVEGQTRGFHAVDISFHNADGEEIEPLKPIKVSMTSEAIKQAVEDTSTVPVVVHVENPTELAAPVNPIDHEAATDSDEFSELPANETDADKNSADADVHSDIAAETSENTPTATIVETTETSGTDSASDAKNNRDTLSFDAGSFSIYAIVYTVDFHYEINGKMYDFSIPGGGFVSLEHVVEVLGIATAGENSENGVENAENGTENANDFVGEVPGVDVSDENGTAYEEAIKLNEVEVSEATKKFVADVESVEFSSPELVWVGKVDNAATVGGLKEANGLEVEYSAELTEEQIAEINAQTVEAGDWALISVQPFTSEETLTVTMKNGDRFVVRVTDAQITSYDGIDRNRDYIIYVDQVVGQEHRYYALRRDGASVRVPGNDLDALGNDFIWRFNYDGTGCWWYSGSKYIDVDLDRNPVAVGNTWRYSWSVADNNSGFDIFGYAHGDQHLSWDSTNGFKVSNSHDVSIKVYEQTTYNYRVETSNAKWGTVGHDAVTGLTDFNAVTDKYKKNANILTAASIGDASFRYWMLGDDIVSTNLSINVGALTFTKDNQLLKAVFGKEYSSEATQRINEWVDTLTGNPITADKTAHVYDYDNRIYEIDFSASSGRYTVEPNITLEFLTDASRSMFFPATLLQKDENDNWLVGRNGSFKYGNSLDLGKWLDEEGVIGTTYYVLTDIQEGSEMSATLYAVYHDGSKWVYTDASYYNAPDGKTGSVREVSSISNGYMKNNNGKKNHLMTGDIYVAPKKESGKDWNRLDYLKAAMTAATNALYDLDPGAQIGLTTFNSSATNQGRYGQANRDDMIDAIGAIQLSGGTNQTSAINLYVDNGSLRNVFTKNSTNKQVAILITDGAPNGTDWTAISNAAKKLRNKNVELFTLGLSLDNVGDNKDNLNGIATDSAHAYSAAQGEEFADQIISMLQKVFSKATLYGDITDTIDPVFYPVDQNGQPIEAGYYYADTTNGAVTRHNNAPTDATKAYYQWINNNGTWTVEWHNQEIKWPEDGGWNKSIFVKAKEDFFGGNSINTNVGDSNKVSSKTFKHSSSSTGYYYLNEDHTAFELPFKIPYVNVDELSLSENSTEWRVYLGTDVNPREELENLWNKIRVNQVIFNNGVNDDEVVTITNRNQMYYSDDRNNDSETPDGSLNETLPLSYFVNSDLLDGLLDQLDDNSTTSTASLTYRYFPYGHDIVGTFDIVLTKTLTDDDAAADHAPEKHETKEVGEEREVYTLTVTYNPTNDNASDTYENTTSGKSAGKVADGYDGTTGNKIDSENVHKIHVFAKDLEIQKKDMTNTSKLIDTAKFKLYRTAKKVIDPETGDETNDYEPSAEELKVGNETKKVVQIGDEMTTSGGKITVEDLSYAPDGTYYLVETKAPDGYIMATEPIEMHLYLDDAYTHYLAPHGSITKAQTVNNPYNWTQAVNRVVYDSSKTAVVDDTKITIEVLNNPGVELPATGGPGTTLIYLLGIMLTAFAGAGLVLRKRRRDAA